MKNAQDSRLDRLHQIAQLLHDADLQRLSEARRRVEEVRNRLRSLDAAPSDREDPSYARAQAEHEMWAATRRKKLRHDLFQKEQAVAIATALAARSLAKSRVVAGLKERTGLSRPGE